MFIKKIEKCENKFQQTEKAHFNVIPCLTRNLLRLRVDPEISGAMTTVARLRIELNDGGLNLFQFIYNKIDQFFYIGLRKIKLNTCRLVNFFY